MRDTSLAPQSLCRGSDSHSQMMMLRGEKRLEKGKNDKAVCHGSSQSTIFRSVPKAKFK